MHFILLELDRSIFISGWVNTLLSWKGIIPLSRLTYCAYLVHPIVMMTYYYSRRMLVYYTDLEMVSYKYKLLDQKCYRV